jgi:hypothetical protein
MSRTQYFKPASLFLAVVSLCAVSAHAASVEPGNRSFAGYKLERAAALPSTDTGWDYSSLDEKRGNMFIGHRKDGIQVFDVRRGVPVKTLKESTGANATSVAPEFDIGIAGTTDGDVVVFQLSTLQTLKRYKSTTEGFDGASYEPFSKRFMMIGTPAKGSQVTPVMFFDAKTGEPAGSIDVQSEKIDPARSDAAGHVFLPLRDKSAVARIDVRNMKVDATWPMRECLTPSSLAVDPANQRVFVACRGTDAVAPAMAVLDSNTGAQIAKLPIGRGTDDMFFDGPRKTIVVVNGDSSMTVISQRSADDYALALSVSTRPTARSGAYDYASGRIHLSSAETVTRFDNAGKPKTTFLPNTFRVLTYGRATLNAGGASE